MRKVLLSLLAVGFLFAEDVNLDDVMVDLNNKKFDEAIKKLKQLPQSQNRDFLLAKAYYDKHLTFTDYELAYNYFQSANTPKANYYLAKMYEKGLGVDVNMDEAIRYYKLSNTKEANFELAKIYLEGKYPLKNPKIGLELLKSSANAGYAKAQFMLGKLYLSDNEIVDKNLQEAAKWIYLAAKNGNFRPAKEIWEKYKLYKYQ